MYAGFERSLVLHPFHRRRSRRCEQEKTVRMERKKAKAEPLIESNRPRVLGLDDDGEHSQRLAGA